jgi:hypothetical protein
MLVIDLKLFLVRRHPACGISTSPQEQFHVRRQLVFSQVIGHLPLGGTSCFEGKMVFIARHILDRFVSFGDLTARQFGLQCVTVT